MQKRLLFLCAATFIALSSVAEDVPFAGGRLSVRQVALRAVRIRYYEQQTASDLPEWIYVKDEVWDYYPGSGSPRLTGYPN